MRKFLLFCLVLVFAFLPSACAMQDDSWQETMVPLKASEAFYWKEAYLTCLKELYEEKKENMNERWPSYSFAFTLIDYNRDGIPELVVWPEYDTESYVRTTYTAAMQLEEGEIGIARELAVPSECNVLAYLNRNTGSVRWFTDGQDIERHGPDAIYEIVFDFEACQVVRILKHGVFWDEFYGEDEKGRSVYTDLVFMVDREKASQKQYEKARAQWIKTYQYAQELMPGNTNDWNDSKGEHWHSFSVDEDFADDEILAVLNAWQPLPLPAVTPYFREHIKPLKYHEVTSPPTELPTTKAVS